MLINEISYKFRRIVAGSLFVKVPQILKILSNKSGAGINIFSVFLELTAITLNLSYSFVKGLYIKGVNNFAMAHLLQTNSN